MVEEHKRDSRLNSEQMVATEFIEHTHVPLMDRPFSFGLFMSCTKDIVPDKRVELHS